MATTNEIIQWVAGKVLNREPGDDEIPSEMDLAEWLTPDAAQAEAREAVAAMGLIGPTATGSVWSDTPGAGSPTDDPNEAIREVPLERWRWQAMGDPEARKAAEAELRESIGADIDFDAVLAILESNIAIVMRPRLVFMAPLRIDASGAFEPGAAGGGVGSTRTASALARHPGGGPAPASARAPSAGVAENPTAPRQGCPGGSETNGNFARCAKHRAP